MKNFSEACERNKEPILQVLREVFADRKMVLEIGSGTGQHAVYFAKHLPHLIWQTSDLEANHPSIQAWIEEARVPNVRAPLLIDAQDKVWPIKNVDAIFSANAVHIMSWEHVQSMFLGIGRVLAPTGVLCLYGPFNYDGKFTSKSNEHFDQWLRDRDPVSGIRNFEDLDQLAQRQGLTLLKDVPMPSNNRCLIWIRG